MSAAAALKMPAEPDLLPSDGWEMIDSEMVEKEATVKHSYAQGQVVSRLNISFGRPPGGGYPGGWWFAPEILVYFGPGQKFRPDVAGWRLERQPLILEEVMMTVAPDWICEVLSPGKENNDLVKKLLAYQAAHVPHYWIVDPRSETLIVLRYTAQGYVIAQQAGRADRIHAEPFEDEEIQVGVFFGDPPA